MATKVKVTSRNKQRKAAYAAEADKSSRNENALEKPVVGNLVREVDWRGRVVKDTVVPEAGADRATARMFRSETAAHTTSGKDSAKRRRQLSAWERCGGHSFARDVLGGHREYDNCWHCGCPKGDVLVTESDN